MAGGPWCWLVPAVVKEVGKDFVKTNKWVVFGHHFAAIAGPGPLVGPVLAAQFGFLSAAANYRAQIAGGGTPEQLSQWQHLLTSQYVNGAVTGAFLVLVLLIVLTSARGWLRIMSGRSVPPLHEDSYVPLAAIKSSN